MSRKIISSKNAPAAIGPYSQAVSANGFIFTSGQIPIAPASGNIEAKDIEGQTRQVMENLAEVLKAAGSDFSHVIKTTIFLSDMAHFAKVNEIYGKHFPKDPPARSTVQVARLPKDALLEIELIALA
ncbi:reactive intermediate/imine deaminase [bacterium CG2_30_54_10]|nr:MAG: reactive intermediate/imine deaminase [bacterium CG2_30_54_10]